MQKILNFSAARLAVAALIAGIPGLSLASLQVYVSPAGSDSANGLSSSTPVKTLAIAVQIVRNQRAGNMSIPATISLAPGRYQLTSPVMLLPTESNLTIVGPAGNTAIITG